MEAGPDLEQARRPAPQHRAALRRLHGARQDLQQGALAGSVPPDDAEDLAFVEFERNIANGPDQSVASSSRSWSALRAGGSSAPGRRARRRGCRRVSRHARLDPADAVAACRDSRRERRPSCSGDDPRRIVRCARSTARPSARIKNAETAPITAETTGMHLYPATRSEAVDDADHRIDRVHVAPRRRHDGSRVDDRRHEEQDLDEKWGRISNVAIAATQCCEPETRYRTLRPA